MHSTPNTSHNHRNHRHPYRRQIHRHYRTIRFRTPCKRRNRSK